MQRGLVVGMGGAAILGFAVALFVMLGREGSPARPLADPPPPSPPRRPAPSQSEAHSPLRPRPLEPPEGLQLDGRSGPDARARAQAILDEALAELRRLDDRHQVLARYVYMRGHSAAERVEDELAQDDEPGRAKLRADEDAMKAELARIYGTDLTVRP